MAPLQQAAGPTLGRGWCSYMARSICSRLSAAVAFGRRSSSTTRGANPFCGAGRERTWKRVVSLHTPWCVWQELAAKWYPCSWQQKAGVVGGLPVRRQRAIDAGRHRMAPRCASQPSHARAA